MTRDSDFKDLVRDRMRATGQPYTAARADLLGDRGTTPPHTPAATRDELQRGAEPGSGPGFEPGSPVEPDTPAGHGTGLEAAAGPGRAEPETVAGPERSAELGRARREHQRLVGRFIQDGRMVNVPMRRKARAAVLLELVAMFEPGRSYREPEVNQLLAAVHEDFAFWRRELVDYGYLERSAGTYRLAERPPRRSGQQLQEFGDWERLWLPGFLAGEAPS